MWEDGEEIEEKLNGVSAIADLIGIKPKDDFRSYTGNYLLMLGSYDGKWGEDDNELIMKDPKILECIEIGGE